MMSPKISVNTMFAFTVMFLVTEVQSQSIIFPGNTIQNSNSNSNFPACDGASYCTEIRRCRLFRQRRDWRTVGVTCGYGSEWDRNVCCPRRDVRTSTTTTERPTRRPQTDRPGNAGCGQNHPIEKFQPRKLIMGGKDAVEGYWPWMVAIRKWHRSRTYRPSCTAFLIDRRHVLSAAHCFDDRDTSLYRARVGRVNQDEADEYTISRITIPERYRRKSYYHDIAILTLSRDVDVPNFSPICLPDAEIFDMNLVGSKMTIAGWGAELEGGSPSRYLKEVRDMPVLRNGECIQRYRSVLGNFQHDFPKGFTKELLCAGFLDGERDTCGGDSGGPLMLRKKNRWFAVAIVAFGIACGVSDSPGGYTKVSSYLDWIKENTRD